MMTPPEWEVWEPLALCFTPVQWERTDNGEFPYQAIIGGRTCTLRVNDFPAEPLYTLLIDGEEALDLEDWCAAWQRPRN